MDNKIVAPFSRIFCDVERFADDELEEMSKFEMGVLYEKFDSGNLLRIFSPELKQDVLKNFYWVHIKLLSIVGELIEQLFIKISTEIKYK